MNVFNFTFYGNTLLAWLAALAVAVVATLALRAVRGTLGRRLAALVGKTETRLDDLVLELITQTKLWFLVILGLYAGRYFLTLPPELGRLAASVMTVALLLQAGLWGSRIVSEWVLHHVKRRAAENAAGASALGVLRTPARIVVWSVVVLMALDTLGIDVTALIAGLGIGGVAVALATQNILGDLFASLSIVLDRPFEVGDFIIVDEQVGTIERIGLKTTRVRALSGELIVFSNDDLLQSRVRNYKKMFERRILFNLGVVYQTPPDTIEAIPGVVREIIEAQPNARFDRGHFKAFGDFSLNFEFVYYVKVPDYAAYADTQHAINLAILRRFEADGIEFAYPTQTLIVERGQASPQERPSADLPEAARRRRPAAAGAGASPDDKAPAAEGGGDS